MPPPDLLANLNPVQREAVTHPGGPLLIVAGAGSGKTRVLMSRVAWLIKDQGISPFQILAINFTNKSADEMKGQGGGAGGPVSRKMWVSTFPLGLRPHPPARRPPPGPLVVLPRPAQDRGWPDPVVDALGVPAPRPLQRADR